MENLFVALSFLSLLSGFLPSFSVSLQNASLGMLKEWWMFGWGEEGDEDEGVVVVFVEEYEDLSSSSSSSSSKGVIWRIWRPWRFGM